MKGRISPVKCGYRFTTASVTDKDFPMLFTGMIGTILGDNLVGVYKFTHSYLLSLFDVHTSTDPVYLCVAH